MMDLTRSTIRQVPAVIRREIARTDFPQNYQRACQAIIECATVDEVAEWANRSAAMACYARQLMDKSMLDAANRIHARALERIGEMLKSVSGTKQDKQGYARQHGISPSKAQQAMALVDIPKAARDRMIESTPAPVPSDWFTKAQRHGLPESKKRSGQITMDELRGTMERNLLAHIRGYAEFQCKELNAKTLGRHMGYRPVMTSKDGEAVAALRKNVRTIIEWLDTFDRFLGEPR